jgi:hypothetical protein
VNGYAGKPWIVIKIGAHEVELNADTKRSAVEAFVTTSRRDPDRLWRVVAGREGRVNKVVPNAGADSLPGWYYLVRPLENPGTI